MIRPLLISRPIDQSEQFAREVAAGCPGRYETVISPLLEIRPEVGSVDTSGAQALLFSSRNAVREFARRSAERNLPALCVGDATAQEAASHGFSAMSANGDVSALAALAEVRGLNTEKLKILAISKNAAVPFANVNLDKIYVSAMPNTQAILKALKTI